MKFFPTFLFLLANILISCQYDPDERYRVDLQPPTDPPELNIDLNIVADTVYYDNRNVPIILRISSANENVHVSELKLTLNGVQLSYTLTDGVYTVYPFDLYSGEYKFKMEFLVNSGSTSIADKLGGEMYQFTSREVVFMVGISSSRWIKESESAEGLTLTWNTGLKFSRYEIRKLLFGNTPVGINTTPINSITDIGYIGELAIYDIYGVIENGQTCFLGRWTTPNKMPMMRLIEYKGKPTLVWKPNMHTAHIRKIEMIDDKDGMPVIIGNLKTTDTLFYLNQSYFGYYHQFRLRCTPDYPINDNSSAYLESKHFENSVILPGPDIFNIQRSNCTNIFYYDWDTLICYSMADNKIIMKQPESYNTVLSPDGQHLLHYLNNSITYGSSDPYSVLHTTVIPSSQVFNFSVSNTGLGVINTSEGLEIYNFQTGNLILTSTKYSRIQGGYRAEISGDGNYLKLDKDSNYPKPNELLFAKIQGDQIVPIDSLPDYPGQFFDSDPTLFYSCFDNTLTIKKIEDFSTVRSINLNGEQFGNIDFCTNRMITKGTYGYHVYDVFTGDLLSTIPLQNGYHFYLTGNTVYFDYGNKYLIQN